VLHRDFSTTLAYADFAPDPTAGARFAARAFGRSGDATAAARATASELDAGAFLAQ